LRVSLLPLWGNKNYRARLLWASRSRATLSTVPGVNASVSLRPVRNCNPEPVGLFLRPAVHIRLPGRSNRHSRPHASPLTVVAFPTTATSSLSETCPHIRPYRE